MLRTRNLGIPRNIFGRDQPLATEIAPNGSGHVWHYRSYARNNRVSQYGLGTRNRWISLTLYGLLQRSSRSRRRRNKCSNADRLSAALFVRLEWQPLESCSLVLSSTSPIRISRHKPSHYTLAWINLSNITRIATEFARGAMHTIPQETGEPSSGNSAMNLSDMPATFSERGVPPREFPDDFRSIVVPSMRINRVWQT
jgi:hypothetical protein